MQLFGGGKLHDVGRDLYDSIEHSMVTVFIVVTGESWNTLWMDTQRELGGWTALYYVCLVAGGDYIILNLVIAVVIGGVLSSESNLRGVVKGQPLAMVPSSWSDGDDDGGADGSAESRCCGCACWSEDVSLGLFRRDHCVRRLSRWLLSAKVPFTPITLEVLVIANVVATSFLVALDAGCEMRHLVRPDALQRYLEVSFLISLGEIGLKVIAHGLFCYKDAYLRSGWNQIDALIAIVCVGELANSGQSAGLVLRSIHVLRPLRLIVRLAGLRQIINLLINVMPRVVNILLVYLLFIIVFSILGIQLFAGKFGSCPTDPSLRNRSACEAQAHYWRSAPEEGSFDDVGSAALLLFEMSSLEGWDTVLYLGANTVGVDVAGEVDASYPMVLFFIVWVFLGGQVVLNVFVGVLIDTFATMNTQERFGGIFTSDMQQQWVETLETMTAVRPTRKLVTPRGFGRRRLFRLVTQPRFDSFILLVILFNTALMALDWYGIDPALHLLLDAGNDLCTAIFTLEAILKLAALGCGNYLAEGWNIFDLVVVLVALSELAFKAIFGTDVKGSLLRIARLTRALRVLRTVRVVRSSRSMRSLLTTLLYSIVPLANILGVFVIITFIYAVLGMELFGGVKFGEYLNEEANFCSFPTAMLTMFRCATGEDWNKIMHDAMVTPEGSWGVTGCELSEANYGRGDCGTVASIPFFISYVVLTTFLVLKMMVALIIENFKLSMREDSRYVTPEHRDRFVEAWSQLDTDGDGRIPIRELPALIRALKPPLGLNPRLYRGHIVRDRDISAFIRSLDIETVPPRGSSGPKIYIRFHDVLLALTTKALEAEREKLEGEPHEDAPSAYASASFGGTGGGLDTERTDTDRHGSPAPPPRSESLRHLRQSAAGRLETSPAPHHPPAPSGSPRTDLLTAGGGGGGGGGGGHSPSGRVGNWRAQLASAMDPTALRQLFKDRARMLRAQSRGAAEGPEASADDEEEDAADANRSLLATEYSALLLQNRWRAKKSRLLASSSAFNAIGRPNLSLAV